MKRVVLFLLCLPLFSSSQKLIDVGIPDTSLKADALYGKIDSVWTHYFKLENNQVYLTRKELLLYNKNGQRQKIIETDIRDDGTYKLSKNYIYENNILSQISVSGSTYKKGYEFEHDESNRIISTTNHTYKYDTNNRLIKVIKNKIINTETISLQYDSKGNLILKTATTKGNFSGNVNGDLRILYYQNKPYASVDIINDEAYLINSKYGTLKKVLPKDSAENFYKTMEKIISSANNTRPLVSDPYDQFIKNYDGWTITKQISYDNNLNWTKSQTISQTWQKEPVRTFTFRKIKFKDGKTIGDENLDLDWARLQPSVFTTPD